MTRPNELFVEEQSAKYFIRGSLRAIQASEIDSTERTNTGEVIFQGRLKTALRQLNPHLPNETIDEVARILSRPPHPALCRTIAGFMVN